MKLVKCIPEFYFTVFLKNRNIISKIKRSKVTDYAALTLVLLNPDLCYFKNTIDLDQMASNETI